jgi:hypothetical protein
MNAQTSAAVPGVVAQAAGTTRPWAGQSSDRAIWGLVAIGVGLRVWQYAGFTSLLFDEINLARNIAERSYAALLKPLDYGQVAPAGFLLVERLFWSLFHTDWSLRLVPLVGAIAALFLFRALALRVLTGVAVPFAVATFAVGLPFVGYGSQVKQYSTDVALALVILLMTAGLLERTDGGGGRRHGLAGLAGFLAVWFSNTAVFVVAGAGVALAALVLAGRIAESRRLTLLTLVPWTVGAIAAVALSLHSVSPKTMAYMKEFWSGGFAPSPLWTVENLAWRWRTLRGVFGMPDGLRYPFLTSVYTLLAVGGFVRLWRVRHPMTLVLAGPIVASFVAAEAHLFPFAGRLVLFLTPVFLLMAASAAGLAVEWLGSRSRPTSAALALIFLAPPLVGTSARTIAELAGHRAPSRRQVYTWLMNHRHEGDAMLVWYRAAPALAWYGASYGLTTGDIVRGGCWPGEPRGFLRDLDRMRGRPRVWLLVEPSGMEEVKLMIRYADLIGVRHDGSYSEPVGLQVWLYDFSDSTRLQRASAASFPVSLPPAARFRVIACTAGPLATRSEPGSGRE